MSRPDAARRSTSSEAAKLALVGRSTARALELDPLIHDRLRLAMLAALSVGGDMSFTDLRQACDATDGNLASHSRRLEAAGYIKSTKKTGGKRPQTILRLSARGRRALQRYLDHMKAVMDAVD